MRERDLSFKDAVNEALRDGLLAASAEEPFETPTFDLGGARIDVLHALELAGRLEDDEVLRKRTLGK